jgi:hypothetical protein
MIADSSNSRTLTCLVVLFFTSLLVLVELLGVLLVDNNEDWFVLLKEDTSIDVITDDVRCALCCKSKDRRLNRRQ